MAGEQLDELDEGQGAHSLDAALSRRVSGRARVAQVGGVLVALVVVMGLVLHTAGVGPAVSWPWQGQQVAGNRTAIIRPSVAIPQVIIHTNVNFGTLVVNGKQQTIHQEDTTVALNQPANVVVLIAPPFAAIKCVLPQTVAPQVGIASAPCGSNGTNGSIPVVSMPLTAQQLPADLAQPLAGMITAYIAQISAPLRTQVPVGQHYVSGDTSQNVPVIALAREPLLAQLRVTPDSDYLANGIGNDLWYGSPNFQLGSSVWTIHLPLYLQWRITHQNGSPASGEGTGNQIVQATLALQYTPNRSWQVYTSDPHGQFNLPTSINQSLCDDGAGQGVSSLAGYQQNAGYSSTTEDVSLEGCVVHFSLPLGGTFLVRFGAMLAVDATAHTLAPALPMASAAEQAAVGITH